MKSDKKLAGVTCAPAYLRKSRAEEGESTAEILSRHRAGLMEAAARHNIEIAGFFEEIVSGESLYARPEMLRLLDGVSAGRYGAVLCMDIDRLGRGGMRDQGIIFDAFRQSGTLIITPDKIYDLSDDDDEEMTEFKAFFARREYKMIRKRMSRGLMRTIMEGGYVANAPYGYAKARIGKLPSLTVVRDEAEFVKYMFTRYLEGIGASTIAEELCAMGAVPRRSDKWSRNGVRTVLKNPTYYGAVPWNRVRRIKRDGQSRAKCAPEEEWLLADGLHEPIVTKEQFEQAQTARRRRLAPSVPRFTGAIRNPLAGLVRCAECGRVMQMMGGGDTAYLLCNTKACCAGAKMNVVETLVLSALEDALRRITVEPCGQQESQAERYEAAVAAIGKERRKIELRRTALYGFLEDGTYSRAEFELRRTAAEDALRELGDKLTEAQNQRAEALREAARNRGAGFGNALEIYKAETAEGKNRLLKAVVSEIFYVKAKKTKPCDFSISVHLRALL